jgi:hypothetical protein
MAVKRTRKTGKSSDSMVADAAQAMGDAVGSAVAAIGSAVGMRPRPNGYQKLQSKEGRQSTAGDTASQPGRSRKRATPKAAKSQTKSRARSKPAAKARKAASR